MNLLNRLLKCNIQSMVVAAVTILIGICISILTLTILNVDIEHQKVAMSSIEIYKHNIIFFFIYTIPIFGFVYYVISLGMSYIIIGASFNSLGILETVELLIHMPLEIMSFAIALVISKQIKELIEEKKAVPKIKYVEILSMLLIGMIILMISAIIESRLGGI